MIRKLTLACAALFFSCSALNAQRCGFDHLHKKLLASSPAYAQRIAQDDASYLNMMQNSQNSLVIISGVDTTYEIPVVIHVMNTGGSIGSTFNPSVAQLTGMIDYLNASYAATWAAYPGVGSGGTKIPFKFVLAKRDTACNPTTGITRYNLSGNATYVANGVNADNTTGLDDVTLKNFDRWPVNEYYNIWVVNKIDGKDGISGTGTFTAGFAYFPTSGPDHDGTIMLASQSIAGQETLPHEIGHAMNLYHVFEGNDPLGNGSNNCPTETNCLTQNDRVCDTEPMKQSQFDCPSGINTCTNAAWQNTQHNFMDYSSCKDRFTAGQRTRMIAALKQYRAGLLSSLGATALPASNNMAAACIPTSTNPANTLDAGPRQVVLNDMTAVTNGGYNDDGNRVYIDRTCQQQANLNAGQTYTISVTTGANENLRVYIDYNNDGQFTTTPVNEQVVARSGSGTQTATFFVPATNVVTCTPLRMRVVSDKVGSTLPTACGPLTTGQAEDYSVLIKGPSNTATVSIALTTGTNPSCINSPLTFTATPGGTPGTGYTFKWYINGVAVSGATASTYTTSTPANGNIVTSRIFYTGPCGSDSALSNSILIQRFTTIAPTVSIALTAGSNPGCAGQSLTFTATPTSGDTAPTYTWTRNGVAIPGATTGNVFTSATLSSGDMIRAVLHSSLSCATPANVTSNAVTVTFSGALTSTATIAQTGGANPTCGGKPVTFTLTTTNGGTAPVYSWLVNGVATGNTGTTFTTNTLNDQDTVYALFISNSPCVTEPVKLSNKIVITVIPSDTPKVATSISSGSNPGCSDSLLEFTAVTNNTPASYTWYLNGTPVSNNNVFGTTGFNDGDKVYVMTIAGPGCHVNDTAYSDTVTITRIAAPAAPVISFIGNMLISTVAQVQWYGPSGLIAGATAQTYHPAGPGTYYARATGNGCPSLPSNMLQVSLLNIGSYNLDAVQIYPNPTSGNLVLDWGSTKVNVTVDIYTATGQRIMQQSVKNASRHNMDLSAIANGIYFVTIRDEAGKTGTVRITVSR